MKFYMLISDENKRLSFVTSTTSAKSSTVTPTAPCILELCTLRLHQRLLFVDESSLLYVLVGSMFIHV